MEEKERVIEQPKKKGKGKVIALFILLFLVVLGLVGYILFDKGIIKFGENDNKTKVEDKKNKKEYKELALDDKEAVELFDIFVNTNHGGVAAKSNTNYYSKDKFDVSGFTNIEKINIGIQKLTKDLGLSEIEQDKSKTFAKAELDKAIKSVFGKNVSYNINEIDKLAYAFALNPEYDAESETIKVTKVGVGGTAFDAVGRWQFESNITAIREYSDKLEIDAKVLLFVVSADGEDESGMPKLTENVYKANADKNKLDSYFIESVDNYDNSKYKDRNELIFANFDKADTYKFTFVKEDDNYIFDKVELVK